MSNPSPSTPEKKSNGKRTFVRIISMKNKNFFLLSIMLLISLCSCSQIEFTRHVIAEIPEHPWEMHCNTELWYSLVWGSCTEDLRTIYVSQNDRQIELEIPLGKTIYICAYPLGEMRPFGNAISPDEDKHLICLEQNKGTIAHLLMNTSGKAAGKVNFPLLCNMISEKTKEFDTVNAARLVTDMLNGKLKDSSIKTDKKSKVPSFTLANGTWVSEDGGFGVLEVKESETPEIELSEGIHRFLCKERNLELRITADSSGQIFHYVRDSLVPFGLQKSD